MGELIEATYPALTDGRAHTDASTPFDELLAELVRLAGSGRAAARLLGVSDTTLYRWRRGTQKPKTGAAALARVIRRASLKPSLEADIRAKRRTMRITGWVVMSRDRRRRTIDVGRHIPARKMGNVISAWLDADDTRAERLLWAAIDRHYVEGIEIDQLEGVEFA